MESAFLGQDQIVRALLDKGAEIEARSAGGTSALFAAIFGQRPSIVKILLEAGANTQGAWEIAKEINNREILQLLQDSLFPEEMPDKKVQ